MIISFSDKEASILLGATLMHSGVPFRFAVRRELSESEQAMIDQASEKLISLRENYQRLRQDPQVVDLSKQEMALLAAVVEDCRNECGDDAVELSLQLQTRERSEIETLLKRMRASTGERYAKVV